MTLVLGDKKDRRVVRSIFEWSRRGIGSNRIAARLNSQGVPSPKGKAWRSSTVQHILRNPAYVGTLVWGKRKRGKFSREINTHGNANSTDNLHDEGDWTVVEDAFPGIVRKKTFLIVQQELKKRSHTKSSSQDRSW